MWQVWRLKLPEAVWVQHVTLRAHINNHTKVSLIQFRGNCGLLNSLFVLPWASTDTLDVFVEDTGTVGVVDVVLR